MAALVQRGEDAEAEREFIEEQYRERIAKVAVHVTPVSQAAAGHRKARARSTLTEPAVGGQRRGRAAHYGVNGTPLWPRLTLQGLSRQHEVERKRALAEMEEIKQRWAPLDRSSLFTPIKVQDTRGDAQIRLGAVHPGTQHVWAFKGDV